MSYLVYNCRQRLNCRCTNFSTTGALLLTNSLPPWLQLGMMPWTDSLLISLGFWTNFSSGFETDWVMIMDLHGCTHKPWELSAKASSRTSAKSPALRVLPYGVSLCHYRSSCHSSLPRLGLWSGRWSGCLPIILSPLHCQLTDGPARSWGRGCPSSKNVLGCSSKISGMKSSSISYFRVPNYRYFISLFLGLELALNLKFHLFIVK